MIPWISGDKKETDLFLHVPCSPYTGYVVKHAPGSTKHHKLNGSEKAKIQLNVLSSLRNRLRSIHCNLLVLIFLHAGTCIIHLLEQAFESSEQIWTATIK